MAFIIRLGKHTARFYRRRQIPLGGGVYKYETVALGRLPLATTELPPDFPEGQSPLTDDEKQAMEDKFLKPAQEILERRREEERERQLDPVPRLEQALGLMSEAAALSHGRPVTRQALEELLAALASVCCADPLFPLAAVSHLARAAADAADAGKFGERCDEPIRDTAVAPLWSELNAAVSGPESTSLIRALQRRRFVKGG